TPVELYLASQAREEAIFDGDAWAFARIARLEGLLEPAGGGALPPPQPRGDARRFTHLPLALTDAGRRVLAGEADAVALLGVDRWVGGTHLDGPTPWRWGRG